MAILILNFKFFYQLLYKFLNNSIFKKDLIVSKKFTQRNEL